MNKIRLIIFFSSIVLVFGLIIAGLWLFYRPQAAGNCATVTVYHGTNYSGTSACLGTGSYKLADLRAKGISNDSISSISIPSGMQVTVYEDDNFGGRTRSFDTNIPKLEDYRVVETYPRWPNWNDRITSLKVVYKYCPSPAVEIRETACPSPQTGAITETRIKGPTPDCLWGNWQITASSCKDPAKPSPTVDLKVNGSNSPAQVSYNAKVEISWSSTNAKKCTASGDWSGSKNISGKETSGNLTTKSIFILNCTGDGSAIDSVTVAVEPQPQEEVIVPTEDTTTTEETSPITTRPTFIGMPDKSLDSETTMPASDTSTPSDSSNDSGGPSDLGDTSAGADDTSSDQDSDLFAPEEETGETTTGVSWLLVTTIVVAVVAGGIYLYTKFKGSQLTSEDLLSRPDQSEGDIVLAKEGKPAFQGEPLGPSPTGPTPPSLPTTDEQSSLNAVLPSNITETSAPEKPSDDMPID